MADRDLLSTMLSERGVSSPSTIIEGLLDSELDGAQRVIARWDANSGEKTAGLLVWMLRNEEYAKLKPPDERTLPPSEPSERLLQAIRGTCKNLNGYSREEARWTWSDEEIDRAMGTTWTKTDPHPAYDLNLPADERAKAYERLLG